MRKKLFLLTIFVILASIFVLSSCNLKDYEAPDVSKATYALNGELPNEVALGEELDLSYLSIIKTTDGTSVTIPVTKEMISSGNTNWMV